jgi:hypothetical protein
LVAGANGDEENPLGDGAEGDSSIPPMRQSALFRIFRRGNERMGGSLVTTFSGRNVSTISTEVEDGSGTAQRETGEPAPGCFGGNSVRGDTLPAASSLSIAAAHLRMSAPTDTPGMVTPGYHSGIGVGRRHHCCCRQPLGRGHSSERECPDQHTGEGSAGDSTPGCHSGIGVRRQPGKRLFCSFSVLCLPQIKCVNNKPLNGAHTTKMSRLHLYGDHSLSATRSF